MGTSRGIKAWSSHLGDDYGEREGRERSERSVLLVLCRRAEVSAKELLWSGRLREKLFFRARSFRGEDPTGSLPKYKKDYMWWYIRRERSGLRGGGRVFFFVFFGGGEETNLKIPAAIPRSKSGPSLLCYWE